MKPFIIYLTILLIAINYLFYKYVSIDGEIVFWQLIFAAFIFYICIHRLIIYYISFENIAKFFDDITPRVGPFRSSNPFGLPTLAAILFFVFVFFPFTFFLSYMTIVIFFKEFFTCLNTKLSEPLPNIILQGATMIGILGNIWTFHKWLVKR